MLEVNFTTFELDPRTNEWIERPVAQLLADRERVTISGPHADWINPGSRSSTPRPPSESRGLTVLSAGHGCCPSPTATARWSCR
jgi:hypothetical protein